MMAKPIKTLELHYPMIQFLIIKIIFILYKYMMEKCCVCGNENKLSGE